MPTTHPGADAGPGYINEELTDAARGEKGFLVGVYTYVDDVLKAIKALRARQFNIETVYSPSRSELITEALHMNPSMVRYFTLTGGVLGILSGVGLAVFTAAQWRFIVQGKPPIPAVPYVVEAFEFCILFSVLMNVFGLLNRARLPRSRLPIHYDPRFSRDRYGVVVRCSNGEWEDIRQILSEAGAEEINDIKR